MGNSMPCVGYYANDDEAATTAVGVGAERKSRKRKTDRNGKRRGRGAAASSRHVVPVDMPGKSGDGEEEEGTMVPSWPAGCRVEHVVGADGGVRVKIVMKRKEVEELVARLEQRDAAERKARMGELNIELGGGSAMMRSPCRDAWRPQLASIPEN